MGSTAAARIALPGTEAATRFAGDLAAITPVAEHGAKPWLGLAVSGGPDSTALLLLAAVALPGEVEAVTIDHQLRPESKCEADWVAGLCERLGIVHRTIAVDVAPGNVQAEARCARYAAMADWIAERGLTALATAHHADDQAETLLLRLNRASGVAGLAGARAKGIIADTDIPLLRPLLSWRKAELEEIVASAGIAAMDDVSNRDDRYDRVRIRKALAGAAWLDVSAIAESAAFLADADAALEWAAEREWGEAVRHDEGEVIYAPVAPRAVALRVITRIVADMDGASPRGGVVARLHDALMAGEAGSIGNLLARPKADGWHFTHAPKRHGDA